MTTISIKDSGGIARIAALVADTGRAAAAAALPVVLSSEDKAALDKVAGAGSVVARAGTTSLASQEFAAANASRRGFSIQAPADAAIWVNKHGGAAAADASCLMIPAGGYYESPAGAAGVAQVNIISTVAGSDFYGEEW
jgi:hypothetical protein